MEDPYQNNVNQYTEGGGGEYTYTQQEGGGSGPDGYPYQTDYPPQEEDARSDATEGADDDDQMYEGEYQGIPHPDEIKEARRAARIEARRKARQAAQQEEVEEENLPEQYESIMEDCGHGRFQWMLFVVLGLALMADGVDGFVVGFVMPSAEKDMCISNADKGLLGLLVYVAMMVGALVWGGLCDKMGRRKCLIYVLSIDLLFSFLSCFAQSYGFFLFFRFCSGFGIGGSIPIVYTYFTEFLQMDKRGEHLSWLCMFWMLGGLYASFTAWGIIPHYGWGFAIGSEFQMHSWRLFILVCLFPALAALVGVVFMPESPGSSWSYHGLGVWFPDMIKYMQYEEYESKVKVFHREKVERFHFNFSLINQLHREGEYIHDKFANIEIKSVKFEDSLFENCYFEDIKSTNTFFENCTIKNTVFYNTDLWQEKFKDCRMENTTFLHPKKGCHLNFQEENDIVIYLVSFLGSLAVLPGNIISALFMDKIGRIRIIGGSMLASSACTFLLLLSFSQGAVICWQCLFYGASVAAWNGLEVISVELYPSAKRGTAFGILNGICKFAAIVASFIFAAFIGVTKIIPIFMAFSALVCGGLVALKLPETREKILS
ncbi:hypothetical protein WMY93_013752 [Mugilogobius chulae]|uniref:Major facilitator superfamily (MFS) profile domain-containing protein n=1 Tax=Mugilogobius chulae TaxID=88201 RepID=A0AAW0P774_9GOBI